MVDVAVLGMGAMGARMAANLLKAGHKVTVWNRTPNKAAPLTDLGAVVAPTPRAAVAGAAFAIVMVRDDAASACVWLDPETGALAGLSPGAVAIESSTLTVAHIGHLAAHAASAKIAFLDAPVAGSRPQAEAAQLIFLVGGERATLQRAEPVLKAMGGAIHHAGPNGAGAAVKLAVNALFAIQVAAMAELIGTLRTAGLDLAAAIEIIGSTPVCSPAAKVAAGAMLAGNFAPLFPVELVEKDLGYALAAAGAPERAPLTAAAREVSAHAIRRGLGADNLTGIVRLYA